MSFTLPDLLQLLVVLHVISLIPGAGGQSYIVKIIAQRTSTWSLSRHAECVSSLSWQRQAESQTGSSARSSLSTWASRMLNTNWSLTDCGSRKRRTDLGRSKWYCLWVGLTPLAGRAYLSACRYLCLPDWGRLSLERCMRVFPGHNERITTGVGRRKGVVFVP